MIWLEEKKAYDLLTDFDGFHGLFSNCLTCQKITIIFLKYIYIYIYDSNSNNTHNGSTEY
jgi:hypothetical protein